MRCIYCGDEFEVNKKGRKRNYCTKIECKNKAHSLARKKYILSKKREAAEGKAEVVREIISAKKVKPVIKDEECLTVLHSDETIIYSINDKETNISKMPDVSDLVEVGRQYNALRFQLCESHKKAMEQLSLCDKKISDLYHKLESMKEIKQSDSNEFTVGIVKTLDKRRIAKNRIYIISKIIDNMPLKNASQFVVESIQNQKNYNYKPRIVDESETEEKQKEE